MDLQLALRYRDAKHKLDLLKKREKEEKDCIKEKFSQRIAASSEAVAEIEKEFDSSEWLDSSYPFWHDGKGFTISRKMTKRTEISDEKELIKELHLRSFFHCIKESVIKVPLKKKIEEGSVFDNAKVVEHASYSLRG